MALQKTTVVLLPSANFGAQRHFPHQSILSLYPGGVTAPMLSSAICASAEAAGFRQALLLIFSCGE
jgi:hypothetical protein